MLPKNNRADKNTLKEVFKEGKFINSPLLSFKFLIKNKNQEPKVSFAVPKSVAKLSVARNKLRRVGYEAIREHLETLPSGLTGVFVLKKKIQNISDIENDIKKIINKIN